MGTTTAAAPTAADVDLLAISIQEKLEQAQKLLAEAGEDAYRLFELAEVTKLERFQTAFINECEQFARYVGPDHDGSEFHFDNALEQLAELLELLQYATRKDG
jgi:hypothetical protein